MTPEEIHRQELLLDAYRRTLRHYLQQHAENDVVRSSTIAHGITDIRYAIRRLKATFQHAGYVIADDPDDDAQHASIHDVAYAPLEP